MRSSGSTPSRPDRPVRLGIVLVGDDHPRACTGRRLLRLGLAQEHRRSGTPAERPVVLDPYAATPLTGRDLRAAASGGLVALDCSWNRLSSDRAAGRSAGERFPPGIGRRLPMLIATNPQHFGRLGELNTAEALAAALYLLGHQEQARALLDGFAGGRTFFEVNRERLDRYASRSSPEEVLAAEQTLFASA